MKRRENVVKKSTKTKLKKKNNYIECKWGRICRLFEGIHYALDALWSALGGITSNEKIECAANGHVSVNRPAGISPTTHAIQYHRPPSL